MRGGGVVIVRVEHKQHSADRRGAVCRQETGPMATIMAGGSTRKTCNNVMLMFFIEYRIG